MKQIVAAIDFSEATTPLLECAAELAEAFAAELTLVHIAAPDPDFVGYDAGPDSVRDDRARELHQERRTLQAYAGNLRDRGLRAQALLLQGPTSATLLREAQRLHADVIVVGSRGHGAVQRFLLGSVSRAVLDGATCPVHCVPARSVATHQQQGDHT